MGREAVAMGRLAVELDEWGMAKGLAERARMLLDTRRAAAARERGRAEAAEQEAEARARSESDARALVHAWSPPPWRSAARPRLEANAKESVLERRLEEERAAEETGRRLRFAVGVSPGGGPRLRPSQVARK